MKHVAVGAPLRTPLGSLQRPPESIPPVKHTSLHNRLGVLKCSKTHLQQTRISKIFRGGGQTPGPSLLDPSLHNEQGRQLSNAGPGREFSVSPRTSVLKTATPPCRKEICPVVCSNLETVREIVLIANRKSQMAFRLVPKSVILNDHEWHNSRCYFSVHLHA